MVQVTGKAAKVHWYEFEDGVFSFHTATHEGGHTTFRSRSDIWPSITASKLGIDYTLLVNATDEDAEKHIATENLILKAVHEV